MNTYVYTALPDPRKYMRLLKLLPSSDTEPDSLRAEVIISLREEAPAYQPLSYTWGQQDASCSIWLRDVGDTAWKPFSIRPNLESCLKHLREKEVRILWVDAICINQTDNIEKGHQVGTMDLVYRSQSLIIWLGDPSENSDIALDLLHSLKDYLGDEPFVSFRQNANAIDRFVECQTDETWAAFIDLINRPWFTRRWIVQEVVLSDHQHAYLGSENFCFLSLVWLCFLLGVDSYHLRERLPENPECQRAHGDFRTYEYPAPLVDPVEVIRRVWGAHHAVQTGDASRLTLERLLDNFSAFDSFDARDGIYAFLSMASDIDTEKWFPDYSDEATTSELYAKATLHIMQSTHVVDIICRRIEVDGFAFSANHFSSWIPWYGPQTIAFGPNHSHQFHGYNTRSLTTFGQPLLTVRSGQKGYYPRPCPNCGHPRCRELVCDGCYSRIQGTGYRCINCVDFDLCHKCIGTATVDHSPTHRFEIHNNKVYFASGHYVRTFVKEWDISLRCGCSSTNHFLPLSTRGIFVDTIKHIGLGGTVRRGFNILAVKLPLEGWKKLQGMDDIGFDNEGNFNAVFLRALVGNRLLTEKGVTYLPNEFIGTLDKLWNEDRRPPNLEQEVEILSSMRVMLSNDRKLATTTRSLGFVPSQTIAGDRIAILVGCSVPVVLRKMGHALESKWMLIGECYIDGMMEGELVGNKNFNVEEIVLL